MYHMTKCDNIFMCSSQETYVSSPLFFFTMGKPNRSANTVYGGKTHRNEFLLCETTLASIYLIKLIKTALHAGISITF